MVAACNASGIGAIGSTPALPQLTDAAERDVPGFAQCGSGTSQPLAGIAVSVGSNGTSPPKLQARGGGNFNPLLNGISN